MSTQSTAAASHPELHRTSLFNLKGRVALVTGGGSGIGLMITQALAVNGAKVYIVGRSADKLSTVASTYNRDIEGEIIPLPGDVTSKSSISHLVADLSSREKALDILVNNAGVSSSALSTKSKGSAEDFKSQLFDAPETTLDDWTSAYATNVASIFLTTTAFLPLLAKSTASHPSWSGTVVNITSISGLVKSAQHHFSYNASKAAAVHLTRMLAAEIAENEIKVRVNSIAPGVFPSEMTAGESDEYQKSGLEKEKYEGKIAAGRPGRDVDMAQAVLMMVACQYLSGQVVAVDGGYTLSAGL
ncbi:putative short chain dehydrogenase reductase [Podospora aff. communis PSN243]|uniref:Short chain dehydrogenase reductase n=1 Tax=Podospora aff. communis PSN243 TaxID=3040156 RepID=A0AAV9G461_9PEZI|nr:putative short chain dehydrogenase reductase [Podospora aff. communis PSN243]